MMTSFGVGDERVGALASAGSTVESDPRSFILLQPTTLYPPDTSQHSYTMRAYYYDNIE